MYIKPDKTFVIDPKTVPSPKILSSGRMIVTDEQRYFMKKLYVEYGLSTWRIGKVMGYLNVCVLNNLKKAGVKLRNRSDAAKRLEVKRDYFKDIDTHTKAYLLGLFYADGNIHKDTFTVALQEPDKYLLEDISKELGMTGKLGFRRRRGLGKHNMWALRVYDVEFCSYLRQWGVVPRKTSELKFPTFLKDEFYYSFLHGLFDGDGCVSVTQNNQIRVCLAGSPQITADIRDILISKYGIHGRRYITKNSKGTCLAINGLESVRFLSEMYRCSHSLFSMSRKKDKFIDFLKFKTDPKNRAQNQTINRCKNALTFFQ